MSKINDLKKTYIDDIEKLGTKSRFGYFSIPPPCSAGDTLFEQKSIIKDQNGRVKTKQRNIYPGITSSGMIKRSFFSFMPSVFLGDTYQDPGRVQRRMKMKQQRKLDEKQRYKYATSLTKTILHAPYEYIPQKEQKVYTCKKDQNGKIIVHPPNIAASPRTKIQRERLKQFKYISDPYDNQKKLKGKDILENISKRGEPMKVGSPRQFFSTNKQQFGQVSLSERKPTNINKKIPIYDQPFRLSCRNEIDEFSYPQYMPQGKKQVIKVNQSQQKKQPFKLMKRGGGPKPTPSITCGRLNLIKYLR